MKRQSIVAVAVVAIGLAFTSATQAGTVAWGAIGACVATSGGVNDPIPVGDTVLLGAFLTMTDSQIQADTTTAGTAALAANFTLVSSGLVPVGGDTGYGGNWAVTFTIPYTSGLGLTVSGKPMYIVALDGGTTFTTASSMMIYKELTFPTDTPLPQTFGIDVADLGNAGTTLDIGSNDLGGVLNNVGPDFTGEGYIQMAVVNVPEPSSIVLVALGLLGGIGLIRRRR